MKFAKPILIALVLTLVTLGVLYTQKARKPQAFPGNVVPPPANVVEMPNGDRNPDGPLFTPTEAEQLRADSIEKALGSKSSLSDLFDTTKVTGAAIDESIVTEVVRVDPADPKAASTLAEGLRRAWAKLAEGTPCKLLIASGTYREAAPADLDWSNETVRNTTFIIEGQGEVIWSGADIFPAAEWKDEGNGLYSHDWPYQFGNQAFPWSKAKAIIGHRSEMAFFGDQPLKPRLLETYTVANIGPGTPKGLTPTWTYTGFKNPQETLARGEFGVAEREENGRRLWVRLPTGQTLASAPIEVSVRQQLLQLKGKRNLVLRGLTVTKVANPERWWTNPISFTDHAKNQPDNILLENCRFLWNSGTGLETRGNRWTLRNVESSYNGRTGITTGHHDNVLWINTTTNFNLWRSRWGGDIGYATGGVKAHQTTNHLVLGHTSYGNQDWAFWYDIDCKNVFMQDIILNGNYGLFWELSKGPFHGRRVFSACDGRAVFIFNVGAAKLEDSVIVSRHNWKTETLFIYGGSNRNDAHADLSQSESFKPIIETKNNVIALVTGETRPLLQYLEQRDPTREGYHPYAYRGTGNLFWAEGNPTPFDWNARKTAATNDGTNRVGGTGELRSPDEWFATQETNSRLADPRLVDAANGDYRFRADSPMAKEGTRYPQVVLSDEIEETMRTYETQKWFEPPQ